jgi:hypothetical protein
MTFLPFRPHRLVLSTLGEQPSFLFSKQNFGWKNITYFRKERHRLEFFSPMLSGQDSFLTLLLTADRMSVIVSIIDKLRNYFWMECVGHIEKVLAVALSSFRVLLGEELLHSFETHQLLIEILDGDLIILGDLDHSDVLELKEPFLAFENVLEDILGAHVIWHQIVLEIR